MIHHFVPVSLRTHNTGYAYIQRGALGYACGLSCINYYGVMPSGGVAYVNGTAEFDDDFIHGEGSASEVGRYLLLILNFEGYKHCTILVLTRFTCLVFRTPEPLGDS